MAKNGPILLIEDDEDDQFLICHAIESLNIANPIQIFPDGRAALEYLETTQLQPFLILCDINMPVMNGLELRTIINQNEYLRNKSIPFVYLTTSANLNDVQKAYNQSVQGFFQKAANQDELRHQLKLLVMYWQECLHPNSFPW